MASLVSSVFSLFGQRTQEEGINRRHRIDNDRLLETDSTDSDFVLISHEVDKAKVGQTPSQPCHTMDYNITVHACTPKVETCQLLGHPGESQSSYNDVHRTSPIHDVPFVISPKLTAYNQIGLDNTDITRLLNMKDAMYSSGKYTYDFRIEKAVLKEHVAG